MARDRRASTGCWSSTPRTRRCIGHAGRRRAGSYARRSSPPGRGRPRTPRDRAGRSRRPAGPAPGCTSCTCPAPTRCRSGAGPRATGCGSRAETCPHYLTLRRRGGARRRDPVQVLPADPRGRQPRPAVGRPGRGRASTCVVSDHSPCTAELKRLDTGDFGAAWGGIASLQLGLPAVWTEAARARPRPGRRGPLDGRRHPAELVGLAPQGPDRGGRRRRPGASFAPDETFVVDAARAAPPEPGHAVRRAHADRRRSAAPGCAARPVDLDGEPRGRLPDAEERHDRSERRARDRPTSPRCPTWPRARSAAAWSHANDELFAERENLIRPEPRRSSQPDDVRPQGQGLRRLGDPPPARARPRLGDRAARRRRGSSAASSSTRRGSRGNYPPFASVEAAARRGLPVARRSWPTRTG